MLVYPLFILCTVVSIGVGVFVGSVTGSQALGITAGVIVFAAICVVSTIGFIISWVVVEARRTHQARLRENSYNN